ncbi:hypothetical protein [Nocardiopsis eucommiae]|uniref:hypothetical protein n=1 Tax=Nocardiopsis eucommiae TaxID=2831970 RepID=UPI003D75729A
MTQPPTVEIECTWSAETKVNGHYEPVACPVVFKKERSEIADDDAVDALRNWASMEGWHVKGDEVLCPGHVPEPEWD